MADLLDLAVAKLKLPFQSTKHSLRGDSQPTKLLHLLLDRLGRLNALLGRNLLGDTGDYGGLLLCLPQLSLLLLDDAAALLPGQVLHQVAH